MRFLKQKFVILLILMTASSILYALPTGVVYSEGTRFYVDSEPFYFAGTNSYDLFTMSEADIDVRLTEMASDGVTVLRTWAWNHDSWHGFETEEGVYDEDQFMLFDYIMETARAKGIRVVVVLSGYWEAYGGIDKRLEWEGLPFGDHRSRSVFFKDEGCKEQYKNYARHFINRINSISGMPYKEDPALFAWQLMNEPRYQDALPNEDSTGETFRAWIDEMGAYIKSLDSNHLVSLGIEGHELRYGFGGDEGNPFIYSHQSPYIDYTTAHPYPTEEWADLSLEETVDLVRAWIHDSHTIVEKPFVMDEFNVHNSKVDQTLWWERIYGALEEEDAAGSCFWEYEGRNAESNFGVSHGDPILSIFKAHSDRMIAKSGNVTLPKTTPGFSFKPGDMQVSGYFEQSDSVHIYYYITVENLSSQGYQGEIKVRLYVTPEGVMTIEPHYEQSDDYKGDPSVFGYDGSYDYFEINFGNRAISPGEKVSVKGGLTDSAGNLDCSNDWSLGEFSSSDKVLTRTVVYVGGSIAAGSGPGGTQPVLTGDVNGDGSIDILDALAVARFSVGLAPANFDESAADVNCDNTVDIVDALLLARFSAGLVSEFCTQ